MKRNQWNGPQRLNPGIVDRASEQIRYCFYIQMVSPRFPDHVLRKVAMMLSRRSIEEDIEIPWV